MSSTVNGSILSRQDRLWIVFLQSHQFSTPHSCASEEDSCPHTGADHSVPSCATPFPIPYKLTRVYTGLLPKTREHSGVIYLNSPITQTSHDSSLIHGVTLSLYKVRSDSLFSLKPAHYEQKFCFLAETVCRYYSGLENRQMKIPVRRLMWKSSWGGNIKQCAFPPAGHLKDVKHTDAILFCSETL